MSSRRARADRAARRWLLTAFWVPLAVCTWLALSPSPPEAVSRISDVVLHAFAFAYLTFALGVAYPRWRAAALFAWMIGYGLLIEVGQGLTGERTAEIKDLVVDVAGIALGLVLVSALGERSRRTFHALLRYWLRA